MINPFDEKIHEHILVCLSSSPSNAKIVRTAAKMADAFGASFTALYVQTPYADKMSDADKKRLQSNIRLAEQQNAHIVTVYGEDISYQIGEFARISRVTKIVLGRSSVTRRHFWSKPSLSERLTEILPNLDIYIIPDSTLNTRYKVKKTISQSIIPTKQDLLITTIILGIVTLIGFLFLRFGFTESNTIPVYILGVLLVSLFTKLQ